jgi:hypothetical protein
MRDNPATKYNSIDELMDHEDGRRFVVDQLNSFGPYKWITKETYSPLPGKKNIRIGIQVTDGKNRFYLSENNLITGKLLELHVNPEDKATNVCVSVKGETLMQILQDIDTVKKHYVVSIAKYGPKFKFTNGTFNEIYSAARGLAGKQFKKIVPKFLRKGSENDPNVNL